MFRESLPPSCGRFLLSLKIPFVGFLDVFRHQGICSTLARPPWRRLSRVGGMEPGWTRPVSTACSVAVTERGSCIFLGKWRPPDPVRVSPMPGVGLVASGRGAQDKPLPFPSSSQSSSSCRGLVACDHWPFCSTARDLLQAEPGPLTSSLGGGSGCWSRVRR